MHTQTAVTETGDIEINIVKSPVVSFATDYSMWGTESHRSGIVLRRNYSTAPKHLVFKGSVRDKEEFIIPNEAEPYQGAITHADSYNIGNIKLFGISDYNRSQKSLIAELGSGSTEITSPIYDRYLIDCDSIPAGVGELYLYSDLAIVHSQLGHVLTRGYSAIDVAKVNRVGSIFALTFEPTNTRIRFAVSFDDHQTYFVFNKKKLVPIENSDAVIAELGNDSNALGYGFRNMIPCGNYKTINFKIVLQSDDPSCTPVFYGFRCSLYSTIRRPSND